MTDAGSLNGSSGAAACNVGDDIKATINGYFPADFPNNNCNGAKKIIVGGGVDDEQLKGEKRPEFTMKNGRRLQTLTAGEIFRRKGFCCVEQKTRVVQWNEDYMAGMCCYGTVKCTGSDISNKYAPEVEEIIRNVLLPQYNIVDVVCHNAVLRRGPGSQNNFYGTGVHQDYGLTLEEFLNNIASFDASGYVAKSMMKQYERPKVQGLMVINFWRPILNYPKESPLLASPLAVCDPTSVSIDDTVHTGLDAGAINGVAGVITDQMALRYNRQHAWYYYPRMTNDECLVFKQFEYW